MDMTCEIVQTGICLLYYVFSPVSFYLFFIVTPPPSPSPFLPTFTFLQLFLYHVLCLPLLSLQLFLHDFILLSEVHVHDRNKQYQELLTHITDLCLGTIL